MKLGRILRDERAFTPIQVVGMVIGIVIAIYIGMAVLNGFDTSGIAPNSTSKFYVTNLGNSWTAAVALVMVIPLAVVGWYILRFITGGGD